MPQEQKEQKLRTCHNVLLHGTYVHRAIVCVVFAVEMKPG